MFPQETGTSISTHKRFPFKEYFFVLYRIRKDIVNSSLSLNPQPLQPLSQSVIQISSMAFTKAPG